LKTIWKFFLDTEQEIQTLFMPRGAQMLHVGQQDNGVYVWAGVADTSSLEERVFYLYPTGENMDGMAPEAIYLGTAFTFQGKLVWHVFYKP
jgi:hypothetical protein